MGDTVTLVIRRRGTQKKLLRLPGKIKKKDPHLRKMEALGKEMKRIGKRVNQLDPGRKWKKGDLENCGEMPTKVTLLRLC